MSAQDAARAVPDDGPVRWRALEIAAFSGRRDVLDALDPAGKQHRGRSLRASLGCLGMLLLVALILAPIAAFVTVVVDWFARPPVPAASIPLASILFLCTLPLLVVVFVVWYRSDRHRDQLRETQVTLLAGFGILTFLVVIIRSGAENYPDGVRWSAGIAVPTLLAAVWWTALLRDARRQQLTAAAGGEVPPMDENPTVPPLERVRVAVGRLSASEQERVRNDLTAAIDDLEKRGVIDAATAERARSAGLGLLALRMSGG